MSKDILVEQDGVVLRVTLNRPMKGNAVTDEMARELTEIIGGAGETSRFIVLRGAGDNFCLGRDVGPTSGNRAEPAIQEAFEVRRRSDVIFDCYGAFRRSALPVVAVIQGTASGFGCALAAVADITIASHDAKFAVPEFAHRILPGMVMSSLMDRVSLKALMYMVYSAAEIGAERALAFGIVSDVVPAAEVDERVERLCATLRSAPSPALFAVKEFARTATQIDVNNGIAFARNLHSLINASGEMRK